MYWEIRLREGQHKDIQTDTIMQWSIPFHKSWGVHFEIPISGPLGVQVHGWNFNLLTSLLTPTTAESPDTIGEETETDAENTKET